MKSCLLLLISACLTFAATPTRGKPSTDLKNLNGAWRSTSDVTRTLMVMDGYFSHTEFDVAQRQFGRTYGGPFTWKNGVVTGKLDFDSQEPGRVGSDFSIPLILEGDKLVIGASDDQETWTRLDSGQSTVAGAWRVSARETKGTINEVPLAPRRMIKLISGARFHWVNIDVATGEFTGTAGGTYTFKDGKYTEHIEFFSGNASRVGTSLTFDGEIKEGKWHHRGKSSGGDPLYQVWSRL